MRHDVPPGGTPVRRDPPAGPVEGRAHGQVARFLGLPFAEPPVGPLRFAAPVPRAVWRDLRPAVTFGPTAAQPKFDFTLIPEPTEDGDDILNLNVFGPATLPETPLPVLVYIHGGGWFAGCNRSPWFDGAPFVEKGVIVVTPGYRLSVEGFMPVAGAPDNRGLLDWIAALEWVRDNIAAFGGDPSRVTISGQSAGAGAVAALMAAPAARGLFHRAFLVSGSIGFGGSMASARAFAERFSTATRRPATVEALADLPRGSLVAGYLAANAGPADDPPGAGFVRNMIRGLPLQPLGGTESLPLSPAEAIARGASAGVPVLVTATRDEFVFELDALGPKITDDRVTEALTALGLDGGRQTGWRALYPRFSPARLLGQAVSDAAFRAPMLRLAALRKMAPAPTWVSEFRWQSPITLAAPMRASHCLDMPFWFDKLALPSAQVVLGNKPPVALGQTMHRALVAFVTGGSPGWDDWRTTPRARIWDGPDTAGTDDMASLAAIFG